MDTKINEALRQAIKNMKIRFPGKVLAEKTGYATSTISEYINDKATPTEDFMQKFANEFGIRFDMAFAHLFDEGRKEQNPLLEQVLDAKDEKDMVAVLIQAQADQAAAAKDIAATNLMLATMLKDSKSAATANAKELEHEVSKLDNMLAGVIKILADQQKQDFELFENEVYRAGAETLKSYKSDIPVS